MASQVAVGEAFVLFLATLGYVPVLRAYSLEREYPWLVAGYTALLVGRAAAVGDSLLVAGSLDAVEYGVGVALVAVCFALHFHGEWRAEESRYRSDRDGVSRAEGD